jgi:hypothetical protein
MRIVEHEAGDGEELRRRPPLVVVSPTAATRRSGRFLFVKAAQALAILAAAFLLLRVVGPWLIDLHNTPALILAVVLLVGGLFALAWATWALAVSLFRKG